MESGLAKMRITRLCEQFIPPAGSAPKSNGRFSGREFLVRALIVRESVRANVAASMGVRRVGFLKQLTMHAQCIPHSHTLAEDKNLFEV